MTWLRTLAAFATCLALSTLAALSPARAGRSEKRYLYVASPGVRNYVEYGGVGLLVFDRDDNYRFVKRIPTFSAQPGKAPENVKGICANARTGKLYISTPARLLCLDLLTEKPVWERPFEGGCDRMSLSPDGKVMYLPSFEGPHWNVVDAETGAILKPIVTNSGAHNTVYGPVRDRPEEVTPVHPVWLLEADVFGSSMEPFKAEIRRQGMTYHVERFQALRIQRRRPLCLRPGSDPSPRRTTGFEAPSALS